MNVRPVSPARLVLWGSGVVCIGIVLALVTIVALSLVAPAKLVFALGGVALLIPTMVTKNPKVLWLFLLVLSIPFDISKWIVPAGYSPLTLFDVYGTPAWGTLSFDVSVTDVLLIAMLLPWLARLCLRRERLYFPKIGYLFVCYLAWALIVSLLNAQSLYLSTVELFRQGLYFLSFIYLINNVATAAQLRSVLLAIFVGLVIGAGSVIVFFEQGIGTESFAFTSLRILKPATGTRGPNNSAQNDRDERLPRTQTLYNRKFGEGPEIKRSQGMFRHPAVAASFLGLTLPIALAYLMGARGTRERILFAMVFAWGFVGLLLTFSRAGMFGFIVGIFAFFVVGGWSRLISRRVLALSGFIFVTAAALSLPLLLRYFETRPATYSMRFSLFEAALEAYAQHPIIGVGLNNSTAAMRGGKQGLRDEGVQIPAEESADDLYLVLLTELGPVGFAMFFVFFGTIVAVALRGMRRTTDMKPLLVGMVAGLASLATQNLGDDTLGGHPISAMLWLFAALVVAISRSLYAETRHSSVLRHASTARTLIPAGTASQLQP